MTFRLNQICMVNVIIGYLLSERMRSHFANSLWVSAWILIIDISLKCQPVGKDKSSSFIN